MTLAEVSGSIGVDVGHLSRIERGGNPSLELARKLAGLYGVTVDEIVGGGIPPETDAAA